MKIAHKLFLVTTLPAALIWFVGLYATNTSQTSLRQSIEHASVSRVIATMDEIDRAMSVHISNWRAYVASPDVQHALQASNQWFDRLPDRDAYIDEQDRLWQDSPGGSVLAVEIQGRDLSTYLKDRLSSLEEAYGFPVFGEAFVTNRYGANVGQTGRTSDLRQDDEAWWVRARDDRVYVGDVGYDESAGIYSTALCLAIHDPSDRFLGVIKVVMDIHAVIEVIKARMQTGGNGETQGETLVLLDADGRVIYSTADSPGQPVRETDRKDGHVSRVKDLQSWTIQTRAPSTHEVLLRSYARSQGHGGYKGIGWVLLDEVPADEALKPVIDVRTQIFVIASITTALALILIGALSVSLSRRVKAIASATESLGRGDLDTRIGQTGKDELGRLAQSFNEMADRLKESKAERSEIQTELINISRRAGMAEVATGVIHNVGNVLNSVNTSTDVVTSRLRRMPINHLESAVEMLQQNTGNLAVFLTEDKKGARLPGFLYNLSESISVDRDDILNELDKLRGRVEHIQHIIDAQQSHKSTVLVNQEINLADVVKRALEINGCSFTHHEITVGCEIECRETICCDEHLLMQILVNLLGNAKRAVKDSEQQDKRIFVRVEGATSKGEPAIRLTVTDNGVGISAENLKRMFQHGFSTRDDGHGFGLHSAANAARTMDGKLTVDSTGLGDGATFTLVLPLESKGVVTA